MKMLNGIISVLLGLTALYLMFINSKTDQDIILGFGVLLMSIIFMCFMLLEERKEEVEQLQHTIMKMKGYEVGYGDESPAEYKRMLKQVGK
jgi:heme/copper-type cytochrome/quinol oxidase subunit 4